MKPKQNDYLDLNTYQGFYWAYFELLPQFHTCEDAFNYLNNQFEYITGKPKYKDFEDFKK